ncbi:MAG: spore cortex-lytic enzyme [Eubacteriales bacterium]|jgi:N-acetylmuramoyl-L-alanine amidase|nr:spore cortex-lytic enzyme [Clostridia bacterium]
MLGRKRLIIFSLVLALALCSLAYIDLGPFEQSAEAANLGWGSQGNKVSELQRKLKQWGYYDGPISGIYGQQTYEAVRFFQRRNGLKVDGIVGSQTAAALGLNLGTSNPGTVAGGSGASNQNDIYLLAKCVHGEARGEPYVGKVAIAAVVLNRVKHPSFPNTIAGVIYQPRAFTAVDDGQINLAPDAESLRAARDAMNGWDPTYGAIYYWNPATATSSWIWSRPVHITIGKHVFGT